MKPQAHLIHNQKNSFKKQYMKLYKKKQQSS